MFKNMKPLPKMILIGLFVGGAVFGYTKFAPKTTEAPVEAVQVEAVQVEAVAERAEPSAIAPSAQVQAASAQQSIPQPVNSPTAQSAGLDALLNLGTKK